MKSTYYQGERGMRKGRKESWVKGNFSTGYGVCLMLYLEIAIITNYQNHVNSRCDLKCAPSETRGAVLIFDETPNTLLRHQSLY